MGFPIDTDLNIKPPKVKFGSLSCNFCGKGHLECRKLIAGPNVMICNECIELCVDIIRETDPGFWENKI
jgi:hypothetical protein